MEKPGAAGPLPGKRRKFLPTVEPRGAHRERDAMMEAADGVLRRNATDVAMEMGKVKAARWVVGPCLSPPLSLLLGAGEMGSHSPLCCPLRPFYLLPLYSRSFRWRWATCSFSCPPLS